MSTTPSLAVSLFILLSLLLSQAQGIRLEKGFISVKQQNKNIHEDTTVLTKETAESIVASDVLGKDCGHDDHCASSGTTSLKNINFSRSSSSSAISSSEKSSSSSSHSHHWLPIIHEDYYGSRRHRAKHH